MSVRRFEAIRLSEAEREAFLLRVRSAVRPDDYRQIEGMTTTLAAALSVLEQDPAALRKLQHLLFGPKSEHTDRVCPPVTPPASPAPKPRLKGHGRLKARDYTGARWVRVAHPVLKPGQRCPDCERGALRAQKRLAAILRIEGSPPIAATAFALERLRCDACGKVFTAPAPAEAGQEKYAPSVAPTIALLRYGTGMPHYRLARLQQSLGVPLPESTQWELLSPLADAAQPIFAALVALAANAPLLHHDDTTMRILDLRRAGGAAAEIDPKRKGTFTSNLLAELAQHSVACILPAGSTREKTWPRCSGSGARTSRRRFRCATRSRVTSTQIAIRSLLFALAMDDVSL